LVKGDLLEILGQWKNEDETNILRRKAALGCVELITELTWPVILDPEKTTVNHVRHLPVIQLAQVEYKRAILQHDSESILHKAIATAIPALTIPRRQRTPRDEGIISLVLYFLRNIAMISQPFDLPTNGNEEDISRSETINAFQNQDVLQLILTICSGMGDEFDEQDVVVLEVLFQLLKGVDPEKLFKDDKQVMNDSTQSFKRLLQAERSMLASQARTAPTRHNRFGPMIRVEQADGKSMTMTGQDVIQSEEKTLQKMDFTKKWNKPKNKTRDAISIIEDADYLPTQLNSVARKYLRSFVSEFLDSSFNPLFIQLRRSIEREVDRVKEDHSRQYFYLVAWFLKAEESRRALAPKQSSLEAISDSPFAYIAGVLDHETFALLNRKMQNFLDDKSWHDVHATLLCFTQIMLKITTMADSPLEDDQDIAENIQARIFYEEQTHDRILLILRNYHDGRQSFAYLDACTELAHVFIRCLEHYSKVNVDMFVKSKLRAKKRAKAKPKGNASIEGMDDEQEEEQGRDNQGISVHDDTAGVVQADTAAKERKFDFDRFSTKFVNEGSIYTFVALLRKYNDLSTEQLKRCHRFFYRVAFKMERPILLYRVDILHLFHKLMKGPHGLDGQMKRESGQFKEWEELIKQIFRKCIRKVEERPEMIVEMLFTKIPNTLFYLEYGYDKEIVKALPRAAAELEIKPGMDHEQKIGVAVGLLVDKGKLDVLTWVKNVLSKGIEERKSWEDLNEATSNLTSPPGIDTETGMTEEGAGSASKEKPCGPLISITPDNEERKTATFKDKHLRLLLRTLAFERLGLRDDPDAIWVIPSRLTSTILTDDLDAIRRFEFDPPVYDDGKAAESFVRNESSNTRRQVHIDTDNDDEEEGASDLEEGLFVPGGPTARTKDWEKTSSKRKKNRHEDEDGDGISEEQRKERAEARRQREKARDVKVKSTLFVTESDDEEDDERNAAFFELEKARREQAIKKSLMGEAAKVDEPSKKGKRKSNVNEEKNRKGKTKRRKTIAGSDDEGDESNPDVDRQTASTTQITRHSTPENEDDIMSETVSPAISIMTSDAEPRDSPAALKLISGNGKRNNRNIISDDDDDIPINKGTTRRPSRPNFIIDDDDDDD